jgi:hypothetical protein
MSTSINSTEMCRVFAAFNKKYRRNVEFVFYLGVGEGFFDWEKKEDKDPSLLILRNQNNLELSE